MNKIYKVIYSKVKQCYIVVSELAKSHVKSSHGNGGQQKAALTMSVLLALGAIGFVMPTTAEADTFSNNMIGINHYYYTGKTGKNGNPEIKEADLSWLQKNSKNWDGKGANAEGTTGAITVGMNAVAGKDTITIGDRNALQSTQSVFIGSNYDADHQTKPQTGSNVVAVGYESDATGNGSIAIGSGASADPWKNVNDTDKSNANKNGNSVAIGYKAQAENNNIAIGANSVATDAASTTAAKYTNQAAAKSYVSVGSSTQLRRITNVADGAVDSDVATIAQLKQVADTKAGTWNLTAGGDSKTSSTVTAGSTVDFSAAKDSKNSKGEDYSNLTVSKTKDSNNVTIGLKKDVILGQVSSGNGGSLSIYQYAGDIDADDKEKGYDQLGTHTLLDGSTISVRYNNGTDDSDARGVVLGVANDSYKDKNNKDVNSPLGYVYLQDGSENYYIHGTMNNAQDKNYQGRLVYNSSKSGYNYIANLDDGISFSGDRVGTTTTENVTKNQTVDMKLDPNATNHTLNIKGGVTDTEGLTSGNIGVVATPTTYDGGVLENKVTSAGGLTIQLAKDLKGITSISNQKTTKDDKNQDVTTGTKIDLKGDGSIDVNKGKITELADGTVSDSSTDAVTGKQLYNLDNSSVKYDTKDDKTVDKTKITLAGGEAGTTITNVKSALAGVTGTDGNAATVATAPTSSLTNAVNLGDLQTAYNTLDTKVNNNKTKYYSVNDQVPNIFKSAAEEYAQYLNADNKGAKEFAGQAAGYMTYTSGIASTVGGSFSGILNEAATPGSNDYRGAAALSYGTFNINDNTSASQNYSGVANSIIGQANMTTDSNAAIIVGAGNSVTNSYRDIDTTNAGAILQSLKDPQKLNNALKAAVPNSGAQVMAIGGGNSVDKAYMTQVVGVGNKVTGSDATYNEGTTTQYNYVDGFQNELTNGKHDYIIGSKNTLSSSNNNIVFGDNHSLDGKNNNVVIGSADKEKTALNASEAVVLGHNADVQKDGGVALGSGSVASVDNNVAGYDPETGKASIATTGTWKATNAAVSVGKADGSLTRQITGVAAGTNDTDAVNVAQIKNLANADASNIGANIYKNIKNQDTVKKGTDSEIAWGQALGGGEIASATGSDKDSRSNGSLKLVTGGTMYTELRAGLPASGDSAQDGIQKTVFHDYTTGQNLKNLDATTVKYDFSGSGAVGAHDLVPDYSTITLSGKNNGTAIHNLRSALQDKDGKALTDANGKEVTIATATGDTLKYAVNLGDLQTAYNELENGISANTYTQGDGIIMDTTKKTISAKAGSGITVDTNGINVNTGNHLSVGTDGKVNVGDNGTVAENDGNLVTGDTVYKALNGGLTKIVVGTPGKDGEDGKDGTPGAAGTIGLVGPAGKDGKNVEVDISVQKGKDDATKGIKGANGVDGQDGITRLVYGSGDDQHQVATLDDGLVFAGDTGDNAAVKLNHQVKLSGTTFNDSNKYDKNNWTSDNIAVVSDKTDANGDAVLKLQLAKDLKGLNSTEYTSEEKSGEGDQQKTTTYTTTINSKGLTITDGPSVTKDGIKNLADTLSNDVKYDAQTNGTNAANLNDVNKMISDATGGTGTIGKELAKKANVDASNIGANLQYKADGTAVTDADKTANENLWGQAIGKGKIADSQATDASSNGSQQLVTGDTVYKETRAAKTDADGKAITYSYIDANATAGENFAKLDSSLQTINKTAGAHTVLTVEGKQAGTAQGVYDGGNLLLHADKNQTTGQVTYDLKLADKITIGGSTTGNKPVTIDGTKGEVSGLNNTDWSNDKASDYKNSNKAATEAQVQKAYNAAVEAAKTDAANNDIHVAAGEQSVSTDNKISMNLVDGKGKTQGTVTIKDVARASDMGNVSDLNAGLKKTDGTTTTVVEAINKVDDKIGNQQYFTEDCKQHTVSNGSTITDAIGALDSAVQNAASQAGKHTIVSTTDSNLKVANIANAGEAANYQISLNKNLNVDSVTATTTTTDNLTVSNSATIGGVTIKDQTISGLKDTDIKEGSTNAVNAGTIWNELRPSGGTYINQNSSTAQNLTSLDNQVKKTSDLISSDNKTIKIGGSDTATKIDVSGKDSSGNSTSRVITGVKTDTSDPNSVANVGYVNDMAAASAQQIYQDMNSAYSHVENDISRAAAGSNALAALHPMQEFDPDDKAQYALGYGHYRNSNAGAVGVFYQPDENSLFSLGASFGNGDAGINAGVTFKFGPGGSGHHALTKTQMAKVIDAQSKEIDALKKDNADKDKRIDALEQKVNEILAKVEKDKA